MGTGDFGFYAFEYFGEAELGMNLAPVEDERVAGDSLVLASITELDGNGVPHLGAANLTVHNVTPGQVKVKGKLMPGVNVRVDNDFDGTLPYRLTVWVLNTTR